MFSDVPQNKTFEKIIGTFYLTIASLYIFISQNCKILIHNCVL